VAHRFVAKGDTFTPKQLHLEKKAGKIYWCDREGMRVMRCNLDGSKIGTLVDPSGGDSRPGKDATKWCVGITIDPLRRHGEGHFWLHCDQNRLMTVAVPLAERNGQERLRSHAVKIRADTGAARDMSLVVFESFVAIAIDYDGGRNDKVADFLSVLRAAKEKVTISYAHKSFDYDVTQLQDAQARFLQLCNRSSARQ
jgi:hypothetical protein